MADIQNFTTFGACGCIPSSMRLRVLHVYMSLFVWKVLTICIYDDVCIAK